MRTVPLCSPAQCLSDSLMLKTRRKVCETDVSQPDDKVWGPQTQTIRRGMPRKCGAWSSVDLSPPLTAFTFTSLSANITYHLVQLQCDHYEEIAARSNWWSYLSSDQSGGKQGTATVGEFKMEICWCVNDLGWYMFVHRHFHAEHICSSG